MEKTNRNHYVNSVNYVRNNIDMKRVKNVVKTLGSQNVELADVDEELDGIIRDLMETYAAEHDLPEGWWENIGTTEDVIVAL